MGKGPWVNYGALRERLDFREVLKTYGVKAAFKGSQATAFCPLPGLKRIAFNYPVA